MTVKLISITPDAEKTMAYIARVSNPSNQNSDNYAKLLGYCIKHKHWSVFEQASMSLEIETTRAIAAQILRHRSFTFQEFCLSGDSRITICSENGTVQRIPIKDLYEKWKSPKFKTRYARSYDIDLERFIIAPIKSVYSSGKKPVYEFKISAPDSSKTISCTREHRVLTKEKGFVPFGIAYDEQLTVALNGKSASMLIYQNPANSYECTLGMTSKWGKIISQIYLGIEETYDIEMDHHTHNFVADGIVVHNSQRYADTNLLGDIPVPDLRRQDTKNRQNSIDDLGDYLKLTLQERIRTHFNASLNLYNDLLSHGIAKESARFVLPLATPTRIYMTGSCRSWITYISLREKSGTQKEHMDIAKECKKVFAEQFPVCYEALGGDVDWNV